MELLICLCKFSAIILVYINSVQYFEYIMIIVSLVLLPIMQNNIKAAFLMMATAAVFFTTYNNVFGQGLTAGMSTLQNIEAKYAVSIVPGASQKDSLYHYYPPLISIPTGTTIAWYNNDYEQPHTVTSGAIGSADSGKMFNSGIMPSTANSFFQYTFTKDGDFVYHCEIHPWRVGMVSTSSSFEQGHFSKISYGGGVSWDVIKNPRSLINIEPITVQLDRVTPIAYNITVTNENNTMLFSKIYNTIGESLPLELIFGGNQTISYGPDFSSTGAYHLNAAFLKKDRTFKILVEIASINYQKPESQMIDEFIFKTM